MAKRKAKELPKELLEQQPWEDLGLVSGVQVKSERVTWDWPGMVVRNALNLIDGHSGAGKSSVMATLAAKICGGARLPEAKSAGPKGSCLWFGSEEHFGGPVVSRWKANGGDPRAIHTASHGTDNGLGRLTMPHQEDRLRSMVQAVGARCVVLDPYTALGHETLDTRHEQSTRLYLESIARVAHEEGVTVLMARHLRKGRSGSLLEHGLGSVTIAAVCRSVLRVERDQQDPGKSYLACVMCNHGPASGVVPYVLDAREGDVLVAKFSARRDTSMGEVMEGAEEPDERDASADARAMLLAVLKNGPADAKTLIKEALDTGISIRTLRKLKTQMGIDSKRVCPVKGGTAVWKWLPPRSL